MNDAISIQSANAWESSMSYLSNGTTWENAEKVYLVLDGNATWKSVKDETWRSLAAENWTYQKRSWRGVI